MHYDFDKIIDRSGTSSMKWDSATLKALFGSDDVLPVWVADMDLPCAEPIIKAMEKRAAHPIYGYTKRDETYNGAVLNWMKRRHHFEAKEEWLVFTPGVVPAISFALNAFCEKGDKIIIQPPVYHPFANVIKENNMVVSNNNLIYENGRYTIDFDHFEELAKAPEAKVFILCNPHNPAGRVFTKEELQKLGEICLAHDVLIIADEIHNDLVYEKDAHTVFTTVDKRFEDITIVLTAPSKTFNIAGMNSSHAFIPNKKIREKFSIEMDKFHIGLQTPFSIEIVKAAYNECEDWLSQLMVYLKGNADFVDTFLKENMPNVKMVKPEGTYLGWLDFSYFTGKGIDIYALVIEKAKVGFQTGITFGENGKDFMRFCYACPRSILEEAFTRIKVQIDALDV